MSKKTKLKDPQQINFIGKRLNNTGATMFFIIKNSEDTIFNFSQNSVSIISTMETEKTVNLLNGSDNENSKIATKKWYVIDSESKGNYSHESPIKFLTSSLQSNLCDYSDAYILVTANITVTPNDATTQVIFKNCAPSEDCGTEINETFIDYANFINMTVPM